MLVTGPRLTNVHYVNSLLDLVGNTPLLRLSKTTDGALLEWLQANALEIPLPDASFDVVLCREGLMLVLDPGRAAAEIRRDYAALVNQRPVATLRDLLKVKPAAVPLPIDQVMHYGFAEQVAVEIR